MYVTALPAVHRRAYKTISTELLSQTPESYYYLYKIICKKAYFKLLDCIKLIPFLYTYLVLNDKKLLIFNTP